MKRRAEFGDTPTAKPSHRRSGPAEEEERPVKCTLNVGGVLYHTSRTTLCNGSQFFCAMFTNFSESGMAEIFIDRDGAVFEHILSYMRSHAVTLPPHDEQLLRAVLVEAQYYQLDGLLELLKPKLIRRLKPGKHFVSDSDALSWCSSHYRTLSELLTCELPWNLDSVTHHTPSLSVQISSSNLSLGTFECPCSCILLKASGEQLVSPLCLIPQHAMQESSPLQLAFKQKGLDFEAAVSGFGQLWCVQQIASALGLLYSTSNGRAEQTHFITQHSLVAQYADGESYWSKPVDVLQITTDGGSMARCKAFDFDNYAGPSVSLQPLNQGTQGLQGFSSSNRERWPQNSEVVDDDH